MSRTVTAPFVVPPSNPVYVVVMDGSTIYNFTTNAFVAQASYAGVTDWTPFARILTDVSTGEDSSIFTATLPVEMPAGSYLMIVRSQPGITPADSDPVVEFFSQTVEGVSIPDEEEEDTLENDLTSLLTDEEWRAKMLKAKQVTVDNQTVIEHGLPDIIAADKHAANKRVAGNGWGNVMRARAVPPSALGD